MDLAHSLDLPARFRPLNLGIKKKKLDCLFWKPNCNTSFHSCNWLYSVSGSILFSCCGQHAGNIINDFSEPEWDTPIIIVLGSLCSAYLKLIHVNSLNLKIVPGVPTASKHTWVDYGTLPYSVGIKLYTGSLTFTFVIHVLDSYLRE